NNDVWSTQAESLVPSKRSIVGKSLLWNVTNSLSLCLSLSLSLCVSVSVSLSLCLFLYLSVSLSLSLSLAVGLYVKSSEPLNVIANLVNSNRGTGVAVLQSGQLTRLVANCVHGNGRGGVIVERECRVELRGNGVYDNGGHGVSFRGDGQVVENDVVGNRGYGIRLTDSANVKVLRNRVQPVQGCGIAVLGPAKAVVHDNLVFQGHPGNVKPPLHRDPGSDSSALRNNSVLKHSNRTCSSVPPWVLENPPPRPLSDRPSSLPPSSSCHPSHFAISMTTRITATVESGCHNNGSVFCTIL
uniref:Right handed beta helix domain-containing protein n=1 Tax=Hucho hucho TaxID=62062 RepID=A0A4W5JJJ1_9TELE